MTKKPDPKPRIPATPLSDEDRALLIAAAARVDEADESSSAARGAQNALWRRLISEGVPKSTIAAASNVTATAIGFRVGRPFPSRANRGSGGARSKR